MVLLMNDREAGLTSALEPTDAGSDRQRRTLSRRGLLGLGGAGAIAVASVSSAATVAVGKTQQVREARAAIPSSPATAAPAPEFTVLTSEAGQATGDIFFTDMGDTAAALITDGSGRKLWSTEGAKSYANLRLQTYQGQPVITWWESQSTGLAAYAEGRVVVTDLAHDVLTTVEPHGGISPDEHEFLITPRGTAFIVSYVNKKVDLRKVGGHKNGLIMNGILEEIDLATGKVLLHWESFDHVDLAESYASVPEDPDEPYDYFHINSVNPTPDGQVVISARHTWTVYKVDRTTGRVRWRLGGKRSDFELPKSATFAWQHDAQFENPTTLRLFDNGSDGTTTVTEESQVLWFSIDEAARTARLERRLVHPAKVSAHSMGNAQRLENGNVFVGWGSGSRISGFAIDNTLLFDATLPNVSYRATDRSGADAGPAPLGVLTLQIGHAAGGWKPARNRDHQETAQQPRRPGRPLSG